MNEDRGVLSLWFCSSELWIRFLKSFSLISLRLPNQAPHLGAWGCRAWNLTTPKNELCPIVSVIQFNPREHFSLPSSSHLPSMTYLQPHLEKKWQSTKYKYLERSRVNSVPIKLTIQPPLWDAFYYVQLQASFPWCCPLILCWVTSQICMHSSFPRGGETQQWPAHGK